MWACDPRADRSHLRPLQDRPVVMRTCGVGNGSCMAHPGRFSPATCTMSTRSIQSLVPNRCCACSQALGGCARRARVTCAPHRFLTTLDHRTLPRKGRCNNARRQDRQKPTLPQILCKVLASPCLGMASVPCAVRSWNFEDKRRTSLTSNDRGAGIST